MARWRARALAGSQWSSYGGAYTTGRAVKQWWGVGGPPVLLRSYEVEHGTHIRNNERFRVVCHTHVQYGVKISIILFLVLVLNFRFYLIYRKVNKSNSVNVCQQLS